MSFLVEDFAEWVDEAIKNCKDLSVNYEYINKLDLWYLDEAVYYLIGVRPDGRISKKVECRDFDDSEGAMDFTLFEINLAIEKYRELIKVGVQAGLIKNYSNNHNTIVNPKQLIKWAKEKSLYINKDLLSSLESKSEDKKNNISKEEFLIELAKENNKRLEYYNRYDDCPYRGPNRIKFWLSIDKWTLQEASLIFCDVNPETLVLDNNGDWFDYRTFSGLLDLTRDYDKNGYPLPVGRNNEGVEVFVKEKEDVCLRVLKGQSNDNLRLLERFPEASPFEWIKLGKEKNILIPWLKWAEENDLIINKSRNAVISETLSKKERNSLLNIIAALHQILLEQPTKDKALFKSQNELIAYLESYKDYQGLSKSNLEKIFPEARKVMGLPSLK